MTLTLEELRDDLIERWKAAFERLAEVEAEGEAGAETVYTEYPAFALEKYTPRKFKPGARVSKKPNPDGQSYEFQLDARGRPARVRFGHPVNGVTWRGVYHYRADEVEHLEFCMETGVPSLYNRLILAGDGVLAEQRFVCNGGGSAKQWEKASRAAKTADVLKDPDNYFLYVTLYQLENGVPKAALEHHEVGGEIHRPTQDYSYGPDGKLQRIVQHWPGGEKRTLFAAKTKTTLAALSERLSEKIATASLARLRAASFGSPLVALELNYRDDDRPIPMLAPATVEDQIPDLGLAARIDAKRWITLNEDDFAPEITDFMQRIEGKEGSALSKMLRAAARRVTTQAPAELSVAEGFIAFAIDWELEGDELAKILKECGATPQQLREWKKKGWL